MNRKEQNRAAYARGKEWAREKALDLQAWTGENSYTWGEAAEIGAYFEKLARRYGLTEEFRENGII